MLEALGMTTSTVLWFGLAAFLAGIATAWIFPEKKQQGPGRERSEL